MFDLLISADLLVSDVHNTAAQLIDLLDLPPVEAAWIQEDREWQYCVNWLRAHQSREAAPTLLEIIGPHPESGWHSSLVHARDAQGKRPMKTHATVVAVSDVSEHLERLRRLAIPHVYSPASDFMPFDRLWVGQTAEGDSVSYDPQHDAGLWLELLPTSALHALPHMQIPTLDAAARMSNEGLGVGARIAARSFLVADVDSAVRTLEHATGWVPVRNEEPASIGQVASYRGTMSHGAALELLQPAPGTLEARHLEDFGPGPYRITFAVRDLQARAERFRAKGMACRSTPAGLRLQIDPRVVGGLILEFTNA